MHFSSGINRPPYEAHDEFFADYIGMQPRKLQILHILQGQPFFPITYGGNRG